MMGRGFSTNTQEPSWKHSVRWWQQIKTKVEIVTRKRTFTGVFLIAREKDSSSSGIIELEKVESCSYIDIYFAGLTIVVGLRLVQIPGWEKTKQKLVLKTCQAL